MKSEVDNYLRLRDIRKNMLVQIQEIEKAMEAAKPTDYETLSKLNNDIMIGVYDYPRNGTIEKKILFALEKLKAACFLDIIKYLSIMGENLENDTVTEKEIVKILNNLVDEDLLNRKVNKRSDSLYDYSLKIGTGIKL